MTAAMQPTDHYLIISADTHAGGSHASYREYLEPELREDFDAWRSKYKNPYKDLGDQRRYRNWDNDMRNSQELADGVVGEVVFPNTVPPFFPSFVLFAGPPRPEEYRHRLAGIRAHNRWLVDWCAEFPARRAGIGQVFFNDINDAIADLTFIKEHGLRGGALIPNIPPDATWMKPLYDPAYEPIWSACEDLDIPVQCHGGTGVPDYGKLPVAQLLYIAEGSFYSQRPLVQLILGGVFQRHPRLKFVMTETGCAWLPPLLRQLDSTLKRIRDTGQTGEIRYGREHTLPRSATEYFHQNCWMGVSQPRPADAAARYEVGIERFMWGSDYPHDEGTYPFTREHLRQHFHDTDPDELQRILALNAADLYQFDLEALRPLAEQYGPTVEEIGRPLAELPDNPNEALLSGAGQLVK
jgi:predicted TIM-barrel fold metal-dependent hydrolase